MKTCTVCKEEKPVSEFYKHHSTKDRLQPHCKECMKNNAAERQKIGRKYLDDYKLDKGCEICGYKNHPAALQFDHLKPSIKNFNIGGRTCSTIETLQSEIDKCRVLCANCHSIHTHDPDFLNKDTQQLDLLEDT